MPPTRHRIDYLGAALLGGGVGALILLTTWGGNEYAWGSPTIIGLGVAGVVLLVLFVWQESRAAEPIIPLSLFRSRVFDVASAMGFTIGMAMFGAIIFIPLFLQLVYGASPTSSGLRMLPLMAGLLAAAIAVGPRDHAGSAATRCSRSPARRSSSSACSCSRGSPSTPRRGSRPSTCSSSASGIGLVMQVLVLVVQNDARPQEIGVATSTATFFRSVGGSFGVAIFGAIFAVPARRRARRGCRRASPPDSASGVHLTPRAGATQLPPDVHADFLQAFAHALHGVFLWGMVIAIVPFALSWLHQEVPLRTTLGRAAPEPAPAGGSQSESIPRRDVGAATTR